ncbi:LacI family DNA-binding transcriptional regulator [Nocardioides zeicaulis]|uniref:LacI family DNA-binding transcriptional regulator n=1 Tax=Nocardioides zeicaulis TaxID=1776857 RepID=A0ABV6DYT5_9ACTN
MDQSDGRRQRSEERELPGPDGGHVNMADVAQRAGVSIATVSRALRGLPGVSDRTRSRVLSTVEELDYVVSPAASSLRGATRRVAVVLPRLDSWFSSTMLATVEATLRQADLDVLLYQVSTEEKRTHFFRDLPTRRKVDAVVLITLPIRPEEEERLDLMGVEVVVAGFRLRDFPSVSVDDVAIGVAAVDHLVSLGHTRIGMIRTSDTDGARWASDLHRRTGYLDAMARHGLAHDPSLLVTAPYGVDAGAIGMEQLLDLDDPPTAVFCYSDDIAVAAETVARRRGLRVPEDVSLLGVDGNGLGALFDITTIDQHVGDQARAASAMVLDLLAGHDLGEQRLTLPTHLVVRGSTGPAPAHAAAGRNRP